MDGVNPKTDDGYHCDSCGKRYVTLRGLDNHVAKRLCRPRAPLRPQAQAEANADATAAGLAGDAQVELHVQPTYECEVGGCSREFGSLIGMRQHMRRAHPTEYNAVQEAAAEGQREAWSEAEVLRMAMLEVGYGGTNMNLFLQRSIHRTIDSIKGRRKNPRYKALVEKIRSDQAEAGPDLLPQPVLTASPVRAQAPGISDGLTHNNTQVSPARPSLPRSRGTATTGLRSRNDASGGSIAPEGETDPILLFLLAERDLSSGDWDGDDIALLDALVARARMAENIDAFVAKVVATLATSQPRRERQERRKGARGGPRGYVRSAERAASYRLAQRLYAKDRAKLANCVLNDIPLGGTGCEDRPSKEEISASYKTIFSPFSPPDFNPYKIKNGPAHVSIYNPITSGDVEAAVGASKSDSAGPDGVKLTQIKTVPTRKLTLLFNAMLFAGHIPSSLKASRTILIPKSGETNNINNYRPITISSVLLRICHKILGKRLGDISINAAQRGFRSIDGCLANNILLHTLLKNCREKAKPHHVLSLDLRKAFDTLSQNSIYRALRRFGVDERFVAYVQDSYRDVVTTVSLGKAATGAIPIRRGVKQGDPLSPFLFNLVLDELLDSFPVEEGLEIGGRKVCCMAYADDLILLGPSQSAIRELLKICSKFFEDRGLSLNVEKCASLSMNTVPRKKKLYAITRSLHFLEGRAIKQISPGHFYKYLGSHYAFDGMSFPNLKAVEQQLKRVEKSPLQPAQKINIIRYHLLPRISHALQQPRVNKKILASVDRWVRISVRKILHLNKSSSSAFVHADIKSGGLGILPFTQLIPRVMISRLSNLREVDDPVLAATLNEGPVRGFEQRMVRMLGGLLPSKSAIATHWRMELNGSYSGNGLLQGSHSSNSGAWVTNPPRYWTGREFCQAVQLRGNLLPTVGIPSNPPEARKCRAGCEKSESLSHVLQHCPASHWPRIWRHDRVASSLAKMAGKRGWSVTAEPSLRLEDGTLRKPDLVMVKNNSVLVSDVGISWEGPRSLSAVYADKRGYYNEPRTISCLSRRYPGKDLIFAPIIIGARGIWCHQNILVAQTLGLTNWEIRSLVTTTILGSLKTYRHFNNSVWRRRR